ncbi:receptor-type tyrosine-protein phosphatase eta isoform X1 [Aphelocoma coerulescens]|uniref:receptor-type tyrosine-protein phosphatase eta isoform X1 n=1 Tax=Aphelocoma coerulescens TaxID=39617 RepID=UPI0036051DD2
MRRLPLPLPCLLLLPPLLLLLLAEVRCTIACTEDCSSKNVTAEPATSSNDDLSVISASGNRTSAGGRVTRAVSDGTRESSLIGNLTAEYIGVTSVILAWSVDNTTSKPDKYRVEIVNVAHVEIFNDTKAEITELIPGTMYNFTVYAVVNGSDTEGVSLSLYTKPSSVVGFEAEYVGVTSVILKWVVNDSASDSYTYRIEVVNDTKTNLTFNDTKAEITELIPGTMYNFTVFAVAADNKTEGEGVSIDLYTKPSPVVGLEAEYVGVTSVILKWMVNDSASDSYTYRIEVVNDTKTNLTFNDTKAEITELIPGTMYNFTVFAVAADDKTEGEGVSIDLHTKPSSVVGLEAEYVGVTSVILKWVVNDSASDSYTYRIEVVNDTKTNLTFNDTKAEITELIPGTMYNFTVFAVAADNATEGESSSIDLYTKPSPVVDLKAEYVGVTSVILKWVVNDNASDSYTYRIEVVNDTKKNLTFNDTKAEITELIPGTMYNFTVFAVAADNKTEGEGVSIDLYTKPSSVVGLEAEYVGVTSVILKWVVNDSASDSYTYRIEVVNDTKKNLTFNDTKAEITELIPGTMYNFTVFAVAADNKTEGEGVSIDLYTKPSSVVGLEAEYVGVTSVILKWMVNDSASDSYTYRIEVVNDTKKNLTFNDTKAEITELIPGTMYNFTVFAVAADNKTEGEGVSIDLYTITVSVNSLQCEPVAKQSFLMLKWKCPFGNNSGFKIKISNTHTSGEQLAPPCTVEGFEQTFQTASLNFFSTYNVSIITLSNGSESSPVDKLCHTSISDPPPPSEVPSVKAVSHSSLSVEFSDFDSRNGLLEAYAVMITTEDQGPDSLKSKLNNTYKDFKKKKTTAYVTYVIKTEQAESPSSHSQNGKNIINVGKGNTMYGYENGPLIPLRSYRACVAGFTNITFMANMIEGEDSYVSFSPCSEPVLLPQDPGVIAGVVIGCLLAIFAVVAVGGFIFWRRRRKDKRNNEVSFSPIKSKMIKVENFESYFKKQQADSNCGFAEEYEELKSAGVHQPKFAAELPENRGKNRYNNVLPYDISRVKLTNQSSGTGDYINANYMPGYNSKKAFIAAQGPLPNTIDDFWRMIWEKSIYSIVMLTKCMEQARTKCEQYWPDKQPKSYGDIIVTMVSEVVLPEWTIRDFTVEKSNTPESHMVRQFHFTSWPDHGVPETTDLLINFRHLVHEYNSQNPMDSPTLVHCSAGVGRTGTFIAIDRLIQQMEMESTVDVYGVVYDLRMHRPLMVQTEDQYIFLNQCVMDIIRSQRERKTDLIYQNVTAMAIYENFAPGSAFGKANGYHT